MSNFVKVFAELCTLVAAVLLGIAAIVLGAEGQYAHATYCVSILILCYFASHQEAKR